ncbi:MAG TPA: hypothetical protein VHY82_03510 [Acetobacteraceae bacterium]|jgi:hypothetical protein|nr:hypothetical protein [Acetobacteraceae bacterium]
MTGFPVATRPLALLLAIAGCAGPMGTIHTGATPAQPPTAFDGSYRTTIRLAGGSAAGQGQNWCQTPGQSVLTVTQGEFSYPVAHPNAPGQPTTVFQATMASDGSFAGQGVGGSVSGHVSGSHIEGRIDGQGCIYDFAGDRM